MRLYNRRKTLSETISDLTEEVQSQVRKTSRSGTAMAIPLIIDADPGVDDIIAILLLLASPEVDIIGYVVTFGNTDTHSGHTNILKLYAVLHQHLRLFPEQAVRFPNFGKQKKPFLVYGASQPLEGELTSAKYFHGRDGLSDISLQHPHIRPLDVGLPEESDYLDISGIGGPQRVLETLQSHARQTVSYLAIGPLTTLALARRLAVESDVSFDSLIGRVVIMGGALDVPGNTSPCAEFNFQADPSAVYEVIHSPLARTANRLQLFPLDLTTHHQLPWALYREYVDPTFGDASILLPKRTPLVSFTSAFLEGTRRIMAKFGADYMELHDPLAAWFALVHPPDSKLSKGWQCNGRHFDVETNGQLTSGMCVVDRRHGDVQGSNRASEGEIQFAAAGPESDMPHVEIGVGTPGSQVLARLLLERIWGVEVQSNERR